MSPAPQRRPSARPASGRGPRRSGGSPKSAAQGRYDAAEELHPIDTPPDIQSFDHWPLDPLVARAIRNMEIAVPTPIQRLAIGPALEGRDVIAKAETGTGKTLAFGAPMVSKLDAGRASVLGLVLCPTRELAQQVANVLKALGHEKGLKVALVVGGDPMQPQIKELKAGAQLVVGTPGRVLDLMKQRFLSFPWTEFAVLDEADEMLEIGFLDDVQAILEATPEERQTLLFSATFPPPLLALARKHTKNPVELATARGVATVDRIAQSVCFTSEEDRPHELRRLLLASSPSDLFLIFCDRRMEVDRLMRRLERLPVAVKALHGGYDQEARFRVMSAFRGGEVRALVATDVASRGLDVTGVTHVINYSPPRDISDYTHRIGRTGRAGRSGKALTFVAGGDQRRWGELTARMTWPVEELEPRQLVRSLLAPPVVPAADSAPHLGTQAPARRAEPRAEPRAERSAERSAASERPADAPRRRSTAAAGGEPEYDPSERRERGSGRGQRAQDFAPPSVPVEERDLEPEDKRPASRGPVRGSRPRAEDEARAPRETLESADRARTARGRGAQASAAVPERRGRAQPPAASAAPEGRSGQRSASSGAGPASARELFEARRRERAERIRRDREQRRLALGLDPQAPDDADRELHRGAVADPAPLPRSRRDRAAQGPAGPGGLAPRGDEPDGPAAGPRATRAPGQEAAESRKPLRARRAAAGPAPYPAEPEPTGSGMGAGSPRRDSDPRPGRGGPSQVRREPPAEPFEPQAERGPRGGGPELAGRARRGGARAPARDDGPRDDRSPSEAPAEAPRSARNRPRPALEQAEDPHRPARRSEAPRPDPESADPSDPQAPGRRRRSRRGPPPEIEAPPIHGSSAPAEQSPGWGGFGEGL